MGYVEIIAILDRSGSMQSMQNEAIGGFNNFLKSQKEVEGEAKITTVLFDDQYELLYNGINLKEAPELDLFTYVPRGMTALWDAIGKTINTVSDRIDKMNKEDRPSKVIVAILTDGFENASQEFKGEDIKKLISFFSNGDWEFIYLAANQDAIQTGTQIGIDASGCYNFAATADGTTWAYESMGNTVKKLRSQR